MISIDSAKPDRRDLPVFLTFYEQYTPKLWGLILSANLPASQSETILINIFVKAWQHPHRQTIGRNQMLNWLLGLAYEEGLPSDTLRSAFKRL
ncbi:sigma-70 family RNA polymerase sigma factor [Spirosoma arcticum]